MARRRGYGRGSRAGNPVSVPAGDLEKKVVELYLAGVPVREIMVRLRIRSMAKIYRILKKYVVLRKRKRKKWRPNPEEIEEMCRLKNQGLSIYGISRHFGRSPSTIWHYARKFCSPNSGS